MSFVRVALCQLNAVVGDLEANLSRGLEALREAEAQGAAVAVFPELFLTGYPPEDLLLRPGFIKHNIEALQEFASQTGSCAAVIGYVDQGRDLYNAAALCAEGIIVGYHHKRLLPNYAVFDEQRYFAPGTDELELYRIGGVAAGISICEDAWSPLGPIYDQAAGGAELMLNLNASPFARGKLELRERMLATRAADSACALVYVNLVGGQDDLVFDGGSMVHGADGTLVARLAQFSEAVEVVDVPTVTVYRKRLLDPRGRPTGDELAVIDVSHSPAANPAKSPSVAESLDPREEVWKALVVGTRDYVRKSGFTDVVIGLSGGVDSTIVAAIAVDALGAEHVHGVSMPSQFSSEGSKTDAQLLCDRLSIDLRTIPIEGPHHSMLDLLEPQFKDHESDVTEENIQARLRGLILMALSNKFGWLVLTTGNKSEMAVGFATLYGDMAGAYGVIKDVLKTDVYDLCRWKNSDAGAEVIPLSVIDKPPSAELRPDQRDDQNLPAYEILDPVLRGYVEADLTREELISSGFDEGLVNRVAQLVDRAEYKRRQSAPGPRVSGKAFGKDRRLPIVNHYRG